MKTSNRHLSVYQKTQDIALEDRVFSASPGELIVMLYDALLDHLRHGRIALRDQQVHQQHIHLTKAIEIINELNNSLVETDETEMICTNLRWQYEYWAREILHARCIRNDTVLESVIEYVKGLRDVWNQVTIGAVNSKD